MPDQNINSRGTSTGVSPVADRGLWPLASKRVKRVFSKAVASVLLGAVVGVPNASAAGGAWKAALVGTLSHEHAQVATTSSDQALPPEAAAQNVRQQVVEFASAQFGPGLLNDFNHPSSTYPTQADTYVMAYARLMSLELAAKQPNDVASNAKAVATNASGAFKFLTKILGGVAGPAGDIIDNAATIAVRAPTTSGTPSTLFEAHLKEAQAVAQQVLSPVDFQAYVHAAETGDYGTQTALLFKMNYEVLNRQPVVNPYVLWWCDMRGSDGRPGTRPVFDFPEIAPGDDRFKQAIWDDSTQVQRWTAVNDALKDWFQRTATSMVDPAQRATYLTSIRSQINENHRKGPMIGPDPEQQIRDTVSALGPEALRRYDQASGDEKSTLLKTATLFTEGINSLLPMLMGVPSLTVDGTVAPLAQRQ